MNAIANAIGQGEPDFAGLTSGITNLDTALKGKLSKIAESINKAKAKAETTNTSLQAKLTKLNADAQSKTQSLENEISKLKTGSEAEKKKVFDKVNDLSKSVGAMNVALTANNGSEQTINALDQIIDKITAQLNSGTPAAAPTTYAQAASKPGLNPAAKPFTPASSKQGMNPNAKPFAPGARRGGYRTARKRSSSNKRTTRKKRKMTTRKRSSSGRKRRSTRSR
jgi:alanyl-tRNA synthetase